MCVGEQQVRQELYSLTAIRGILAWWVVLYHFRDPLSSVTPSPIFHIISNGYLAVDFFFVLSGFVLSYRYIGPRLSQSHFRYINFTMHRWRRIYPAHIVVLLLFTVNPVLHLYLSNSGVIPQTYDPAYFLLSCLLVQNWGFTDELAWNVPAWSISTEWFAYLCFPGMLILLRKVNSVTFEWLLYLLLIAYALPQSAGSFGDSLGESIPEFGLLRCLMEFAIGCLTWRLLETLGPVKTLHRLLFGLGAVVPLACYASGLLPDYATVPLAFSSTICLLAYAPLDAFGRPIAMTLLLMGRMSYSTYIVHYLIRSWVKMAMIEGSPAGIYFLLVYLGLSLLGSILLYLYVERRFYG